MASFPLGKAKVEEEKGAGAPAPKQAQWQETQTTHFSADIDSRGLEGGALGAESHSRADGLSLSRQNGTVPDRKVSQARQSRSTTPPRGL